MRYSSEYNIQRTLKSQSQAKNAIVPLFTTKDGEQLGDDSLASTLILGRPNTGKTANILIPAVLNGIEKGEILIVGDSKGIILAKTIEKAIENGYEKCVVNFVDPLHSDSFNLLKFIYFLYHYSPYCREKAICMLDSLAKGVIPIDNASKFWEVAPQEAILGAALYLFEFFPAEDINFTALRDVISEGEKKFAGETFFSKMAECLDEKLDISNPISSLASAPSETRGSITTITKSGLGTLCSSELSRLITERDDIDLFNLDTEKKRIFYFILPEETHQYNTLASLMLDCVIKRFYEANRVTGEPNKRRINIIIDELGNLNALPDFDTYCTTARSRNIRIVACIQSLKQLSQSFGHDKAQIIEDSVGTVVSFACSNIETLNRLSERSGLYTSPISGKTWPTISANSIARLENGHALVFSGELIFTTQFEFDESKSTDVAIKFPEKEPFTLKQRTDILKPILNKRKEEVEKLISEKMSREIEQTTFKPKKKSIFSRIFRKVFKKKKRTPFDSLPF